MRRAFQKMIAVFVAVGLTVSGPISSHARMSISAHATTHENQVVPHYADLAIDPGAADCPHALPGATHGHDDGGVCNKCCATCIGASLIPAVPVSVRGSSLARDTFLARDDTLIACPVLTDPGIPKRL